MAITPDSLSMYMTQWLQTATKGNVVHEFRVDLNSMVLICKVCDQKLEVSKPESATKIDYGIQEFIKLHRHTGDYQTELQRLEEEKKKLDAQITAQKIQLDALKGSTGPKPLMNNLPGMTFLSGKNYEMQKVNAHLDAIQAQQKKQAEADSAMKKLQEIMDKIAKMGALSQLGYIDVPKFAPVVVPEEQEAKPEAKPLEVPTGRKFR